MKMMLNQKPFLLQVLPRWWLFSLVNCLFAMTMGLLGHFHRYSVGLALFICLGFLVGVVFPLHAIILTDLFPLDLLPSTFGFNYFALGLGGLLGPPLAGMWF